MEKAWHWIKEHPVVVIGVLGALVILYMLVGSGSNNSGGGTVTQTGPSDAAIQAGAALQMAQVQAGVATSQFGAELAATQSNNNTQVQIAKLSAQVANYQTEQSANVQEAGISATKAVNLAGIQSQQVIQLASYATQAQIASTAAHATETGYKEQTKQLQAVEQANVQMAQAYVYGQVQSTKAMADASKHNSDNGLFGGIVGAIASIF